jgi:tetratricopeptide (TPR) repeat protein
MTAEADTLFWQGVQQEQNSQFQAAIQSWQQALRSYREIGDRFGEVASLDHLGSTYCDLKQYQKAIEYYQQVLNVYRELDERTDVASSLTHLGLAYDALGQYLKNPHAKSLQQLNDSTLTCAPVWL